MIIRKLKMDLQRSGITPTADAVQGDVSSRALEISLYNSGKSFQLPDNLAVLISYKKADGKGGEYDTLPDGAPAWSFSENRLTVQLAPQMLTFPGTVSMTVSLVSDGTQVSTFPIQINVLPEAKAITADSEDYFNVTGFLVAPSNAEPGQFLKISSVNSEGRVTQVESGFPDQIPADWNAAEGETGHILNRPFYEADGEIKTIDKKFLPDDVGGVNLSGAAPGQMILIKAVDETGKPTQWEAIDPVTGADWDAAEGESGHILNRPFYSTIEEGFILPECQPTYDETEGTFYVQDAIALEEGQAYTVSWNGVSYPCTAVLYPVGDDVNAYLLGDLSGMNPELVSTGEPFLIMALDEAAAAALGVGIAILPSDGSTSLTLSITGIIETVEPIPEKYLTNVRGQNKYIINFDSGTINVSLDTLMAMDSAEIQSCLSVVYNGVEHSVDITERSEETLNGTVYQNLYFSVPGHNGVFYYFHWNSVAGIRLSSTKYSILSPNGDISDYYVFVKQSGEENPAWRRVNETAMPGIVLRSTTSGSSKTFLITVDDSGTLTATEKAI